MAVSVMREDKEFIPGKVKLDTCVAVAYSMLTSMPYEDSLKLFPNGKIDTIQKLLDIIRPEEDELILYKFLNKHKRGRFLVCLKNGSHIAGHAIAVIDGIAYNTLDYNKNAEVLLYSDLSNTKLSSNTLTSYIDELEKHKNIKDNKYINYAYQKAILKFGLDILSDGSIRASVNVSGTDGFTLVLNNKLITFKFPFNCTDADVKSEIDKTIMKTNV